MTSYLAPSKFSRMSSVLSTSSAPGANNSIWDAPETLSHQSIRGDFNLSTLSSSSLGSNIFGNTCEPRVKPKSPSVADHIPAKQSLSPDLDPLCENGQSAQTDPVADTVTSGELFVNFKDLLLAIAENSNTEPQIQHNSTPSINFGSTKKNRPDKPISIKEESESVSFNVIERNLKNVPVTETKPHSKGKNKGLEATLEHIMPSDLHNRFRDDPGLCVASLVTEPGVRCRYKARGQSIDKHTVLEAVSRCIGKVSLATLPENLKKLAKIFLCGTHQNVALIQPKAKARIDTLREFIINLLSASEEDALTFKAWTMVLANLGAPIPIHCSARKPSLTDALLETKITIASNSKITPNLPGFLSYKSTWSSDADIIRDLKKVIAKPLTTEDLKRGFIYIFWDLGGFGMVKIGRTNNLKRRLKEWKRCKSTHVYHKASQNDELPEVPHVQRIELLMKTELVNIRKIQPCDVCARARSHDEWFQISEAKAIEVFQKWRAWMLSEPYMENDKGKWVIKPEMLEKIPELCTLKPEKIVGAKIQPRPAKNRSKHPKPR